MLQQYINIPKVRGDLKVKDFSRYETADLHAKDLKHNMHPFTDFASFKKEGSLIMAESDGAYVYDTEGKKYLDGIAGLWCVNIGYGVEEIGEAMAEQTRRIPYYSTFGPLTTPPAAELAAKLAALAPGNLNHVFFGTGGSMSNDTAVRMIHFYFNRLGKKDKKQIITRTDGYHGSTYLAMTLTGVEYDHIGFDLAPDLVHRVSAPNVYRRPDGMTEAEFCDFLVEEFEQKILEIGPERVAAFFAEPIAGAGGVLVPPEGYHQRIDAICKKYEVIHVADEVVTAFGRLGEMFSCEKIFGYTPDIITCAKGLTSGYIPLSANLISEEIYDVISMPQAKGAMFTHGFTYSGHPVSTAVGIKNIEIIERLDICGHVRKVGKYFENQLKERISSLPLVGDVRGSHFMMCVENVANKETKELLSDDVQIGNRIAAKCEENGVLIRPLAHKNIMSPPLILSADEVDLIVNTLHQGICDVQDDLVREGVWKG
ncbi:aminotransferase [Porticoccaceae bacterium]|nr:aminotransferase [Porticoccaceae bacterium]MDA8940942.1 aminotransferase [Porticoccaceae bacterium]